MCSADELHGITRPSFRASADTLARRDLWPLPGPSGGRVRAIRQSIRVSVGFFGECLDRPEHMLDVSGMSLNLPRPQLAVEGLPEADPETLNHRTCAGLRLEERRSGVFLRVSLARRSMRAEISCLELCQLLKAAQHVVGEAQGLIVRQAIGSTLSGFRTSRSKGIPARPAASPGTPRAPFVTLEATLKPLNSRRPQSAIRRSPDRRQISVPKRVPGASRRFAPPRPHFVKLQERHQEAYEVSDPCSRER